MNRGVCHDHNLSAEELLEKYRIRVCRRAHLTVAHTTGRQANNTTFPHRDHSLAQLVATTLLEPVNVLSFFSAAALMMIYVFNREERQHLLVFLFTAAIIVAKTAVEVHEEAKINMFYRRKIDTYHTRIVENDQIMQISKELIAVGDVLDLQKGDIVGADSVLFRASDLVVDTSALSGSHNLVRKHARVSKGSFADAENVVLEGHRVVSGHGMAVAVRIGGDRALGQMCNTMVYRKDIASTLLSEMSTFFYGSMAFSFLLCCVLVAAAATHGMAFSSILSLAVSVFVAVTPEGIASTAKLLLFSAVSKLDAKGITVKDVGAIEKLGLVTTIAAEKRALVALNCKVCSMIFDGRDMIDVELAFHEKDERSLRALERIGHVSSLIGMKRSNAGRRSFYKSLEILGNVCSRYFVGFTRMSSRVESVRMRSLDGTVIDETDFKSIYVTGNVRPVLKVCNKCREDEKVVVLTPEKRRKILRVCNKMRCMGCEAIALAGRSYGLHEESIRLKGLVFECVYFLEEEPGLDMSVAADILEDSGVGFSILTSATDEASLSTSRRMIGISQESSERGRNVIQAEDYKKKSTLDKIRFISSTRFVVYGCDAEHKTAMVRDLQARGHVVSFFGSGIDDCNALSSSDCGVCFGDSGQICKEASWIVLQPQRFKSIAYAIEEGRLFFVNLQKSVRYILMHITPQIIPFVLYALLGTPLPLSPILLIFLNYLIEVIPSKFFAYEDPEYNLMLEKPISRSGVESRETQADDSITGVGSFVARLRRMIRSGTVYSANNLSWATLEAGLISGLGCMLAFYMVVYQRGVPVSKMFFSANRYFLYHSPDLELRDGVAIDHEAQANIVFEGQSTFFVGLVICQFCNMLVCRREREYFFSRFFSNTRILLFSLLGVAASISIVSLGFFDRFLLVRCPSLLPLVIPSFAGVLIIAFDTLRKYRAKTGKSNTHQTET